MKQKRILIPTRNAESWRDLLAKPEKHWRPTYSAMSMALSWKNADGMPIEVSSLFQNAEDPSLRDADLALAVPEYMVSLDGGSRPSQNDVFAIVSSSGGLIAMMVEGKKREDFDVTLGEWKRRTSEKGANARLLHICENIGLRDPISESIRYQLLHRSESAVLEAKRFHAAHAAIVIQSFEADDALNHYLDFAHFLTAHGQRAVKSRLIKLTEVSGITLYGAWVKSLPNSSPGTTN